MDNLGNDIPMRQASEQNRCLLRARRRNYHAAKITQGILVLVSILLPVVGVCIGAQVPEIRPYLALASLILLVMEAALFDRIQKERLKRGAKLQEQFDTDVFGLPWNRFVTGAPLEHEDIRRLSAKPLSGKEEAHFQAWYEVCISRLPLHLARLIGQRTNISYDARLRRRYGGWLLTLTILFGVVLLYAGLYKGLQFPELIMTLVVPFMPVLNWALRDRMQQVNAATSLTNLSGEWEKIWAKALGGADAVAITAESRSLQDAIYQHRERSPLVFDWVYSIFRTVNEDEAHHAAEDFVQKAEKALRERGKA